MVKNLFAHVLRKNFPLPHLFWLFLLAVVVLWPAPACAVLPGSADKVRLQLRWFHQFQFAGYYAAKAKGYYSDAGLDVKILERDLKVNPVEAVLSGGADFGVTNSELLIHRASGKPVVALAAIFQHSPLVLLTTKASEINTPHDLIGKRVLMSTKTMDVELLGMLREERIPLSSINIIDRFSRKEDYFDPTIDAVAAYVTNQPYYLDKKRVPYSVLNPSSYGIDFYGDCLFTSEEQIRLYPERTKAFLQASLKGWLYAMEHPDEIVDLILSKYQTEKSRDHLKYEAKAINKLMLPGMIDIGHMNPGRWGHINNVFRELGIVDSDVNMEKFLYNPDRQGNGTLERLLLISGGLLLALAVGSTTLGIFNRKLHTRVQKRTAALTQKAAELEEANRRLTELDRVKSALLSSVSHELRTPLTSVLGFVKLVRKEFETSFAPLAAGDSNLEAKRERITKNLNVVAFEGERLTRLISDVLDLARIESGKIIWRDRDIDIKEITSNAGAVVQEMFARNPSTRLVLAIEPRLPTLRADPDRIVQVLINLLTNAAKFTPEGEVRMTVSTNGKSVRFDVSDTGIGIPKEELSDVFNMFHQVWRGDTLKNENYGAGLGLAICKEIVEHYGGTITVDSELGKGSTFSVVLPLSRQG